MSRAIIFAYSVVCYLLFLITYLYFIGFVENVGVPTTLDGAPTVPLRWAVLNNLGLIVLFGVQHSVMARPGFKRAWTMIVPKAAERSTYVLFSCVALFALCWFWQPMGGVLWRAESTTLRATLYALSAIGWLMVPTATLLINHFDLFGVRQAWLNLRREEYTSLQFGTPGPYRFVRHPLYVGWLIAFWATPDMTAAHLLMAVTLTAYILIAIRYEERDLMAAHGEAYRAYRSRTPMLVPGFRAGAEPASLKTRESEIA